MLSLFLSLSLSLSLDPYLSCILPAFAYLKVPIYCSKDVPTIKEVPTIKRKCKLLRGGAYYIERMCLAIFRGSGVPTIKGRCLYKRR
jgi:hypothetical protein